jgi:hypothetical protein
MFSKLPAQFNVNGTPCDGFVLGLKLKAIDEQDRQFRALIQLRQEKAPTLQPQVPHKVEQPKKPKGGRKRTATEAFGSKKPKVEEKDKKQIRLMEWKEFFQLAGVTPEDIPTYCETFIAQNLALNQLSHFSLELLTRLQVKIGDILRIQDFIRSRS